MNNRWLKLIIAGVTIALVTACGAPTPPTELAPKGDVVSSAIATQLARRERLISEQLNASTPKIDISQIAVKRIEPIYIDRLPAYHLQGTYNLKIKLPRQQVSQRHNPFDIYLQRQVEGKTWRLLVREGSRGDRSSQWASYLIK